MYKVIVSQKKELTSTWNISILPAHLLHAQTRENLKPPPSYTDAVLCTVRVNPLFIYFLLPKDQAVKNHWLKFG